MDLENICKKSIDLIKETALYISYESESFKTEAVESKGVHDFVSFVDKTSEKKLVAGFKLILPEAGFIAEEQTETFKGEKYNWIIDPLDGTTNFIHGLAPFAISVALIENDEIILGIVHEITRNETFYAWKGSKAYLNEKEINVSKAGKVADSLIATGFPYYDYGKLPQFMNSIDYFMRNSHGLRRLGSAATDLAYVACGRFDAFYEYSLNSWDVAAGAFIVKQAGGKLADFSGSDNYIFGKEIIAANSFIFDEFLNITKKIFNENLLK
ncbi:MAG: inositol monophosphatase [Bacteroidales bacterium]|nr:inositol monophosphatase [Bacteroidales bacterium]MBN2757180.1 inositol monophosphatase [Bacteroidales bacterium]